MPEREIPITFRLHGAMCGALGIGNNLNKASESDLQIISEYVGTYKRIRDVIQFGRLYRLKSLAECELQAVQYNREGKSVVFVFLPTIRMGKKWYRLKLRGLEEEKTYQVKINGEKIIKSGSYLVNYGVEVNLTHDYDSQMI